MKLASQAPRAHLRHTRASFQPRRLGKVRFGSVSPLRIRLEAMSYGLCSRKRKTRLGRLGLLGLLWPGLAALGLLWSALGSLIRSSRDPCDVAPRRAMRCHASRCLEAVRGDAGWYEGDTRHEAGGTRREARGTRYEREARYKTGCTLHEVVRTSNDKVSRYRYQTQRPPRGTIAEDSLTVRSCTGFLTRAGWKGRRRTKGVSGVQTTRRWRRRSSVEERNLSGRERRISDLI